MVVFDEIRRACRQEVIRLRAELPELLEGLVNDGHTLLPKDIQAELKRYYESEDEKLPVNEAIEEPPPNLDVAPLPIGAADDSESDSSLMRRYYDEFDYPAYELLYQRKVRFKRLIKRRYPGLDEEELYDDTFHRVANTLYRPTSRYDFKRPFDAWLWVIAKHCAIDALRRRTPVCVLRTLLADTLPAYRWRISLDEEVVELTLPDPTIAALKAEVQKVQCQKTKTRWKWSFDVTTRVIAERGEFLEFRIFSNVSLKINSVDHGLELLSPLTLGFSVGVSAISVDQASELRDQLLPQIHTAQRAIGTLPAANRLAILLCDLLAVPLGHAVDILHAGQPGRKREMSSKQSEELQSGQPEPQPSAKDWPPFGTVGQWRSAGKKLLSERTELSSQGIDAMLEYMSCAYYDASIEEGQLQAEGARS